MWSNVSATDGGRGKKGGNNSVGRTRRSVDLFGQIKRGLEAGCVDYVFSFCRAARNSFVRLYRHVFQQSGLLNILSKQR
jgi:hypothetical protein